MILNPICPFSLSNRPLVLPSKQTLVINVAENQRSGVLLTVDGQDTFALECNDEIYIKQSPYNALLIFAGRNAYYSALMNKLFWSPSPAQGDVNA
jgi:NAD+ kinase